MAFDTHALHKARTTAQLGMVLASRNSLVSFVLSLKFQATLYFAH